MKPIALLFISFIIAGCGSAKEEQTSEGKAGKPVAQKVSKYPEHVGDITHDAALDAPGFEPCQKVIPQYYALGANYRVDNDLLMSHFESVDASPDRETLYHTIRFIVNCKGKIGRLRFETMSMDFQPVMLNESMAEAIKDKLLAFDQWPQGRDFYQYLTFKIEQGQIKEVLP